MSWKREALALAILTARAAAQSASKASDLSISGDGAAPDFTSSFAPHLGSASGGFDLPKRTFGSVLEVLVTQYRMDALLAALLLLYFVLYLWGHSSNGSHATKVFQSFSHVASSNFARLGSYSKSLEGAGDRVIEESPSSYMTFLSGRAGALGMHVRLTLEPRQELGSLLLSRSGYVARSQDLLTFTVFLPPRALDAVAWALFPSAERTVYTGKFRDSVSAFAAAAGNVGVFTSGEDSRFCVMTDSAELAGNDQPLVPRALVSALLELDGTPAASRTGGKARAPLVSLAQWVPAGFALQSILVTDQALHSSSGSAGGGGAGAVGGVDQELAAIARKVEYLDARMLAASADGDQADAARRARAGAVIAGGGGLGAVQVTIKVPGPGYVAPDAQSAAAAAALAFAVSGAGAGAGAGAGKDGSDADVDEKEEEGGASSAAAAAGAGAGGDAASRVAAATSALAALQPAFSSHGGAAAHAIACAAQLTLLIADSVAARRLRPESRRAAEKARAAVDQLDLSEARAADKEQREERRREAEAKAKAEAEAKLTPEERRRREERRAKEEAKKQQPRVRMIR